MLTFLKTICQQNQNRAGFFCCHPDQVRLCLTRGGIPFPYENCKERKESKLSITQLVRLGVKGSPKDLSANFDKYLAECIGNKNTNNKQIGFQF